MKVTLLLALAVAAAAVAASPRDAGACGMASQYRLLPLGVSEERIIALEFDQFRFWEHNGRDLETVWSVKPRLVALAGDAGAEPEEIASLGTLTVSDAHYVRELSPVFDKAVKRARREPGFVAATLVRRTECGLRRRCGMARVTVKEGRFPEVRTTVHNRTHRAEAVFPAAFLEHRNAFSDLSDDERSSGDAAALLADHPDLGVSWSLGSTRLYRAGARWFAAHDLATGDTRFMTRVDAPTETHARKPAAEAFYHEPVAHHGHNYDVVVGVR